MGADGIGLIKRFISPSSLSFPPSYNGVDSSTSPSSSSSSSSSTSSSPDDTCSSKQLAPISIEPDWALPLKVVYPPIPNPIAAIFFIIGLMTICCATLVIDLDPFQYMNSLVFNLFIFLVLYVPISGYLSKYCPLLGLCFHVLMWVQAWHLPQHHTVVRFAAGTFNEMCLLHAVELWRNSSNIYVQRWNIWWHCFYLIGFSPVLLSTPLPECTDQIPEYQSLTRHERRSLIHKTIFSKMCVLLYKFSGNLLFFMLCVSMISYSHNFPLYIEYPLHWLFGFLGLAQVIEMMDSAYSALYYLLGIQISPTLNDPFKVYYLSEFWGGRWNRSTHSMLKNNFYTPLKRRGYKLAGVFAAFVASGVLHVYPAVLAGMPVFDSIYIILFFCIHAVMMRIQESLKLPRDNATRIFTWATIFFVSPFIFEPMNNHVLQF